MLEATIVKIKHEGEKRARKLLPFIQTADVYSPESAAGSEPQARQVELELEVGFSTFSRTKFNETIRRAYGNHPIDQQEYVVKQFDYLHGSKKPIWYVERFTPEEAAEVQSLWAKTNQTKSSAGNLLERGHIDDFLNIYWDGLELDTRVNLRRDLQMGEQISKAEKGIRKRYPQLHEKENIHLVVNVGAFHFPERYTEVQCTPVDLVDDKNSVEYKLDQAQSNELDFENMKPYILAGGLWAMTMKGLLKLTEPEIIQMDFQTMSDIVKRFATRVR